MKKSDFISLLSKSLENYSEVDIKLSAEIIQKVITESLKKDVELKLEALDHFALEIESLLELEILNQASL